jgi:hypothetical protein
MATGKKPGIVAKMKNAIAGMFSSDSERKPPGGAAAKDKPSKGAAPKAARNKVATPVKKTAKSRRKAVARKAPAKKAATAKKAPGERKVGAF